MAPVGGGDGSGEAAAMGLPAFRIKGAGGGEVINRRIRQTFRFSQPMTRFWTTREAAARTHANTQTRTHAHTHIRTRTHTHTHTHTDARAGVEDVDECGGTVLYQIVVRGTVF